MATDEEKYHVDGDGDYDDVFHVHLWVFNKRSVTSTLSILC